MFINPLRVNALPAPATTASGTSRALCGAPGRLAGLASDEENRSAPGALEAGSSIWVLFGDRPLTAAPRGRRGSRGVRACRRDRCAGFKPEGSGQNGAPRPSRSGRSEPPSSRVRPSLQGWALSAAPDACGRWMIPCRECGSIFGPGSHTQRRSSATSIKKTIPRCGKSACARPRTIPAAACRRWCARFERSEPVASLALKKRPLATACSCLAGNRQAAIHPTSVLIDLWPGRSFLWKLAVGGWVSSRHLQRCYAPPPGLAVGEPEDRLRRSIQYVGWAKRAARAHVPSLHRCAAVGTARSTSAQAEGASARLCPPYGTKSARTASARAGPAAARPGRRYRS